MRSSYVWALFDGFFLFIFGVNADTNLVGRKAAFSIRAMNRMATLAGHGSDFMRLRADLQQYKDESEKVRSDLFVFYTHGVT